MKNLKVTPTKEGMFNITRNGKPVSDKELNKVQGFGKITNEFYPNSGNKYSDLLTKKTAQHIIIMLGE